MKKNITLTIDKALHFTRESFNYAEKLIYDFAKYNLCNHIDRFIMSSYMGVYIPVMFSIDDNHIFCINYIVLDKNTYGSFITYRITASCYELHKIANIRNIYDSLIAKHFIPMGDTEDYTPPLRFLALYYKIKYKDLVK